MDEVEFETEEGTNRKIAGDGAANAPVAAVPKATRVVTPKAAKGADRPLSAHQRAAVRSLATTIAARATRSGRIVKPTEKAVQWQSTLPQQHQEENIEVIEKEETTAKESLVDSDSDDESVDDFTSLAACMIQDEVELCGAEEIFYDALADIEPEFSCVGAGIGGGFADTSELHVMKYNEAMQMADAKEVEEWHDAVAEEKERMDLHGVFQAVPMNEVPKGAKILTSTWAMKKKANGTKRARLNARGFEQVDGEHYNEDDKAAPVVTLSAILVLLTLIVMLD